MMSPSVAGLVFAVILPMACSLPGEIAPREDTREDRRSIVGSAAHADTTHSAVVAIVGEEGSLCSGTVVQRNVESGILYVLTAAHCCPDIHPPKTVRIGADYAEPSLKFPVVSFQRHPCHNSLSNDYDFCVVEAKDEGRLNVTPIPLAKGPDEIQVGGAITFVGYGSTPALNTLRRRAEGRVLALTPLTITADQTSGLGGICFGDSGGPALVLQNGAEAVAGVGSFVAPTSLCNIVGVDGRVAFRGVRDEFLDKALAGQKSTLESALIQRQGITPGAVRDTYIASDEPERSLGSRVDLLVGAPPASAAIRRALLRFDLSGIPAGATVLTARVGLHNESRTGPSTIDVHRVTKDWDEATETWASFGEDGFDPTPVASFGNATAIVMAFDEVWFDVTPLAMDWLYGRVEDLGILLEARDHEQTQLLSSELGRSGERPWMQVCYLPKQP